MRWLVHTQSTYQRPVYQLHMIIIYDWAGYPSAFKRMLDVYVLYGTTTEARTLLGFTNWRCSRSFVRWPSCRCRITHCTDSVCCLSVCPFRNWHDMFVIVFTAGQVSRSHKAEADGNWFIQCVAVGSRSVRSPAVRWSFLRASSSSSSAAAFWLIPVGGGTTAVVIQCPPTR